MQRQDLIPFLRLRGILPTLVLGSVLGASTGCPAKQGCVGCHISGAYADGTTPSAAPNSALHVQLAAGGGEVSEIRVTMKSADGNSETLTYSGEQVAGVSTGAETTIPDPGLYDIDGKAPAKATIDIVFKNGKSLSDSLGIETEKGGGGTDPTKP